MSTSSPNRLVLIVDDDEVTTDLYARVLHHIGLDAHAADGHEVLEELQRLNPAAVIMDLQMPMIDGLTILREMRKSPNSKDTPVAIVTGHFLLDAASIEEIRSLGAHLAFKPLFFADVIKLAKTLLPEA